MLLRQAVLAASVAAPLRAQQKPNQHLFRIEHGKIAEHWDTIETIPSKEQWKNDNGKF